MFRLNVLLCSILSSGFAYGGKPLTLEMVQESVLRNFYDIRAKQDEVESAKFLLNSSEGFFDTKWKTKAYRYDDDKGQNRFLETTVDQQTSLWGSSYYGGMREGNGEFTSLDTKLETDPRGEAFLGLRLPILRDREIDDGRAQLAQADLQVDGKQAELRLKIIESILKASLLYWDWVAAGQTVDLFDNLLKIAKDRDVGLRAQAKAGAIPRIELTENRSAILKREAQVVKAKRDFEKAAIALSVFMSVEDDKNSLFAKSSMPSALMRPKPIVFGENFVNLAKVQRPELRRLEVEKDQLMVERDLQENNTLPATNLQVEMARPFNRDDGPSENWEPRVLLSVDIPIQNRKARGKLNSVQSKIDAVTAQIRLIEDRIEAQIDDLRSALEASLKRIELAKQEVTVAEQLEAGEKIRFREGESNQLFVNMREQSTADASARFIQSLKDYYQSVATLDAALGRPL